VLRLDLLLHQPVVWLLELDLLERLMSQDLDQRAWNLHLDYNPDRSKIGLPYSEEEQQYFALALSGEVGELCNLLKKRQRGDAVPDFAFKVAKEIGDIENYLSLLATSMGINRTVHAHLALDEYIGRFEAPGIAQRGSQVDNPAGTLHHVVQPSPLPRVDPKKRGAFYELYVRGPHE